MIKLFLALLILVTTSSGLDKLYFLPSDKNLAIKDVENLIKNSKTSIDIAMYNIKYKKLIKLLNKASLRGVDITIFYEKKEGEYNENIKFFKTKDKLHTKIAIFDKKVVFYGSANWKKKSFKENYEVINISDEKEKIGKFNKFFKELKENN